MEDVWAVDAQFFFSGITVRTEELRVRTSPSNVKRCRRRTLNKLDTWARRFGKAYLSASLQHPKFNLLGNVIYLRVAIDLLSSLSSYDQIDQTLVCWSVITATYDNNILEPWDV